MLSRADNFISAEDVSKVCRTKRDLYDAMRANDYNLPAYTSSMVTMEYMLKVRKGDFAAPKTSTMNRRNCNKLPMFEEAYEEFLAAV